jgi:hypothetical protein
MDVEASKDLGRRKEEMNCSNQFDGAKDACEED